MLEKLKYFIMHINVLVLSLGYAYLLDGNP